MRNKKAKISYEPEADILRIEASKKPIEYATEIGDVVVHFSPEGLPVYFEILNASNFLKKAQSIVGSRKREFSLAH